MGKKVTVQDIADALGLSRNTVSKAINNSDGLAESTKQMILEKAVEMGYKQFSYVKAMSELVNSKLAPDSPRPSGEVSLFTSSYLNKGSYFANMMLDKLQYEIGQLGYSMVSYFIQKDSFETLTLPPTFDPKKSSAVVCAELFSKEYADLVCSLDLPVLFVDGPCMENRRCVNCDLLMMDNETEISQFIHDKAAQGLTRFGFIGDRTHCQSFYERYCAFRISLDTEGLKYDEKFVISPEDQDLVQLEAALRELDEFPDVFICANDFLAIDAMMIFKRMDSGLLNRIRFLGFDDSHESRIFTPALSTVHIHTQSMAYAAVQLLMSRMQYPAMEYRTVHISTDLMLRESTEF